MKHFIGWGNNAFSPLPKGNEQERLHVAEGEGELVSVYKQDDKMEKEDRDAWNLLPRIERERERRD